MRNIEKNNVVTVQWQRGTTATGIVTWVGSTYFKVLTTRGGFLTFRLTDWVGIHRTRRGKVEGKHKVTEIIGCNAMPTSIQTLDLSDPQSAKINNCTFTVQFNVPADLEGPFAEMLRQGEKVPYDPAKSEKLPITVTERECDSDPVRIIKHWTHELRKSSSPTPTQSHSSDAHIQEMFSQWYKDIHGVPPPTLQLKG